MKTGSTYVKLLNWYYSVVYDCVDYSPCDNNPCHSNAICDEANGTFTCTCKGGFSGNGTVCVGRFIKVYF